jgi:hypothetical protein
MEVWEKVEKKVCPERPERTARTVRPEPMVRMAQMACPAGTWTVTASRTLRRTPTGMAWSM